MTVSSGKPRFCGHVYDVKFYKYELYTFWFKGPGHLPRPRPGSDLFRWCLQLIIIALCPSLKRKAELSASQTKSAGLTQSDCKTLATSTNQNSISHSSVPSFGKASDQHSVNYISDSVSLPHFSDAPYVISRSAGEWSQARPPGPVSSRTSCLSSRSRLCMESYPHSPKPVDCIVMWPHNKSCSQLRGPPSLCFQCGSKFQKVCRLKAPG